MQIEYETQVLGINPEEIKEKLRSLGAKESEEIFQKRWVFDIACLNNENPGTGEWIRLRQAGNKTTLTYKNKKGTGISDTQEIELEVNDFDKMAAVLGKLNSFTGKYYQENKRTKFVLNDIEFTIEQWPMIPQFLEIESTSEENVHEGLKLLGLESNEHGHFGLINIYAKYNIDIHSFKELKF